VPQPSLQACLNRFSAQTQALENLVASLSPLAATHQKLVAEIIMIRLCLLLENTLELACAKVLCGAQYLDATHPQTLVAARSVSGALFLMRTHGRKKPLVNLHWTRAKLIRENVCKTLDSRDPLFACVRRHTNFLTEARQVRDQIAHKSSSSTAEFRKAVRSRYGALRRGMTPGLYLLQPGTSRRCKLEEFLIASRVLVRDLVRA
jgi:hypothetical protein